MNSDRDDSDESEPEERPIEALHDFSYESDPAFRASVRRSIDRRITGGEMVRLSTQAAFEVVLEFLSLGQPKPPKRVNEEE